MQRCVVKPYLQRIMRRLPSTSLASSSYRNCKCQGWAAHGEEGDRCPPHHHLCHSGVEAPVHAVHRRNNAQTKWKPIANHEEKSSKSWVNVRTSSLNSNSPVVLGKRHLASRVEINSQVFAKSIVTKGTNMYINEELCSRTVAARKSLMYHHDGRQAKNAMLQVQGTSGTGDAGHGR